MNTRAKKRLKISATLENDAHLNEDQMRSLETDIMSVLERHGLHVYQLEKGGLNYVHLLVYFAPLAPDHRASITDDAA